MQKVYFNWVILIDDDFASNYYHKIILEESGLVDRVEYYQEAKEVLKFFEARTSCQDRQLPDLLFLDLNMPVINGWEFLDKLKTIRFDTFPNIVILTTSNSPKDKEKADKHEMVLEFLTKPLEKAHLEGLYQKIHSKSNLSNTALT